MSDTVYVGTYCYLKLTHANVQTIVIIIINGNTIRWHINLSTISSRISTCFKLLHVT